MLKRALVNKLNAPASMSEILHRAKAFLITDFQAVHFFGSLPTFFHVWERFALGRSSLEVVYSSSAESELLGRWRLPSGVNVWRSPRGTSMSRCQQSEFSPFCREGGSGASRQHLRCEADDSSTAFDLHRAVMCMGCALEMVHGLQHQQCFTLFFFQF